jgi:hypothetical protein
MISNHAAEVQFVSLPASKRSSVVTYDLRALKRRRRMTRMTRMTE